MYSEERQLLGSNSILIDTYTHTVSTHQCCWFLTSQTGDARKREEMQELPRHADQAGVPQFPLPRYLQECEGPGAGPAGKLLHYFLLRLHEV